MFFRKRPAPDATCLIEYFGGATRATPHVPAESWMTRCPLVLSCCGVGRTAGDAERHRVWELAQGHARVHYTTDNLGMLIR